MNLRSGFVFGYGPQGLQLPRPGRIPYAVVSVLRYITVLLAGLLAYFGFGGLVVGRDVFRGAWLVGAVFIGAFIVLGPVVQARLRRKTIAEYPRCGRCGYDLTGHVERFESGEARCPECGERLVQANIIPAGQLGEKQVRGPGEKLAELSAAWGTVAMLEFALLLADMGELREHLWIMAMGLLGFWLPLAMVYWRKRSRFSAR